MYKVIVSFTLRQNGAMIKVYLPAMPNSIKKEVKKNSRIT